MELATGIWARRAGVFAAAMALAACGGGGGDGGASGSSPSPSPTPAEPATINALNATEVGVRAVGIASSVLPLGQLAAGYARRFAASAATVSEPCANGGFLRLDLIDRDGDGRASPGDRVTATLGDCGVVLFSSVLNGTLAIEITVASESASPHWAGTVALGAGVTQTGATGPVPGTTVTQLGSLGFDWAGSELGSALSVASTPADDLRVVLRNGATTLTDAFRAIAVSKVVRYDEARSRLDVAMRYQSDELKGTFTISTPRTLLAYVNTFPDDGELEVRSAGAAMLRLKPHGAPRGDLFDTVLDVDGDGVAERSFFLPWGGSTSGYLWWDGHVTPSWDSLPFSVWEYSTAGFTYTLGGTTTVDPTAGLWLQFSRPPVSLSGLGFRYRDMGSTTGAASLLVNVDVDPGGAGALVLLRPRVPLRPGRYYSLEFSTDGVTWSGTANVSDLLGNVLTLNGFPASFATPDAPGPSS